MKKNLRIVSAAAAALLAVAPVAVSVVSTNTVQAADIPNGETNTPYRVNVNYGNSGNLFTVVNPFNVSDTSAISKALQGTPVSLKLSNTSVPTKIESVSAITVKESDGSTVATNTTLTKEERYTAEATVTLSGLEAGKYYSFDNGTTKVQANSKGEVSGVKINLLLYVTNKNATEAYFINAKSQSQLTNGETLGTVNTTISNYNLQNVLGLAESLVTTSPNSYITTNTDDVKAQLQKQGLTVANDGTFNGAGKHFNITLTVKNYTSGKTATVVVPFFNESQVNNDFPIIQLFTNGSWMNLKQGDYEYNNTNAHAIVLTQNDSKEAYSTQFKPTNYFRALINSNDKNNFANIKVTENTVDMSKAGVYKVTVAATNAAGKTTTVTVPVYVNGLNGTIKRITTKAGFPVQQYRLVDGKMIVNNNDEAQMYNGQLVTAYDTKTIDGVEYTRVISADSNVWVKSSDLQAAQDAAIQTGTVKVMHNSYIYNEKHVRVGSGKIATYSEVAVFGTKEINGKKFYRVSADKEEYIDSDNVDGNKRTLKHNAYIYKTSKKRANKRVVKKGETIVTYGSPVTFANGKKYYRIEGCTAKNKMYIKASNF